MKKSIETRVTLSHGGAIPVLGLGVYQAGPGSETVNAVKWALEAGYRHIDTAAMYGNEKEVGSAIKASGVPREDIFVTTKLWNSDHGYDRAIRAFDDSLKKLGIGYVDLYLIHWPVEGLRDQSWRALETLLDEGKAMSIGVSNYTARHLEELLDSCNTPPAVNQVEFHPFLFQSELLQFCRSNYICLEAYSPLTKGNKLGDRRLVSIAGRYGKSVAQILIRWAIQHDVVVIPKSSNKSRIEENARVFDFEISEEDMSSLDGLNEDLHITWDPTDAP
ncbi:MAG: aldo/keto reductase [Candidatus Latescibacterota bacterium]|jgi:diketogulonate reductase-like aldo/keto reductase